MPRYWIGIDQGSTATKACLIDHRGRLRARAAMPVATAYPGPLRVEQDPESIFRSVRAALARVTRDIDPARIGGVGLAAQRSTFLFWDRDSGRPLTPALSWQDRRGDPFCRRLSRHAPMIRSRTGLRLSPHYAASKIRWLLDRGAGLRRRIRSGSARGGTIDAFLLHRLTGGAACSTDPTHAARTLLMDLRRRAWDPVLLGLFGIPAAALPPIRPTTAPGASIRIRGREIPILATLGDQQSALIGLGCLRPGDLAVNYGTGGFVVMNTGRRPRRSAGLLTSAAWSTPLETRYLLEGTINSAGSALDWMERIAGFPSRSKRRIPDLDRMPVLIPAFAGLAAPHWASEARGALLDLTLDTEAGDLHVATLAGLACRVREIVEAMEAGGAEIRRIVAGGGLVRNPGLLPIQAAILGRSVHRADGEEATARGAALLAGHAAGEWRLEDFAASAGTGLAIRPAISRLAANRYFTRFRAAVATLTGHPRGSRLGRDRGRGLR